MSHASKLSEWREIHRLRNEQQKVQANIDCQGVADAVLEKLIKKPFDIDSKSYYPRHFVYVCTYPSCNKNFYMDTGKCDSRSFKTIMQARCQAAFGEKCAVITNGINWDVGFWLEKD